eukprot:11216518-Lingulodinium_polyedra.AAC.1
MSTGPPCFARSAGGSAPGWSGTCTSELPAQAVPLLRLRRPSGIAASPPACSLSEPRLGSFIS